jgi:hypothetical protein
VIGADESLLLSLREKQDWQINGSMVAEFGRFAPEFINTFKPLAGRQGFEFTGVMRSAGVVVDLPLRSGLR